MGIEKILAEIEFLKTTERTVRIYGEWEARTYEDKMLVNAVLDELKERITSYSHKDRV